ncbi:hypothetical protein CTN06_03405 [Pectobacterium zantedeschiae]|uniref:Uncharacterized protein n=1 Tax=Pectobacterium zantedeschiae TaxID=2034769 RepID=A0A9X8P5V4_9GAMM|nr:hypothetical protein CTN06_17620 [Pectobacterium zantedeschiae]RYC44861.1 hypothetical protein CLR69_07605 [Pectobacterium zantedeschiae]RYC50012.1 hypothetical protein CTN06_03405 [Pectobacterium zantedeschiae]
MLKAIKKILLFLSYQLGFLLLTLCFFWICYIVFVGYAPWSEKVYHLVIAIILMLIFGKFCDWYNRRR